MLRITKLRTNRSTEPAEALRALDVAQEAAEAAAKIEGVQSVKVYLGGGGLVFAAEAAEYATADRVLTDPGCQQAIGRLAAEFGYNVESDEFLLDPPQVFPFLKR
jgi:hypothetical protein